MLKSRQMTADRGQGHAETTARRGQTAGLGNGNENIDGGEPIHGTIPENGRIPLILISCCQQWKWCI
jgi:hypothetical protein